MVALVVLDTLLGEPAILHSERAQRIEALFGFVLTSPRHVMVAAHTSAGKTVGLLEQPLFSKRAHV